MKQLKHICGACDDGYETEKDYLAHTCKTTGAKPTTIKHLDATSDGKFSFVSKAALKRGEAKKKK